MGLRSLRAGLRALFRRDALNRELDDELRQFVDDATRENIRAGMDPAAAARAARAQVGSLRGAREEALSGGWETRVESLLRDVRFGLRAMRRNPGFTAAAVATVALGIGANTAMFSVINAVLVRPLPWPDATRLVLVYTDDVHRAQHREPTAYRTITDWQSASRAFEQIAHYSTQRVAVMTNDPSADRDRSRSALVSGNFFATLGVAPLYGRTISAPDVDARAGIAVISYGLWQRWFRGSPDVLGKPLTVDDVSKGGLGTLTVVGVMPPGFYFPDRLTEIWTPATTYWRFARESTEWFPSWARRWVAVGRLRPGSSVDDARSDLASIGSRLTATHVSTVPDFPGFGTTVLPIRDSIVGQPVQIALWLLLGAVTLVLLIACANVANLLLARGSARLQEFAVRRALGAGRGRLARQLVIESLLLSVAGGVAGVFLAAWGTGVLASAATGFVPLIDGIAIDWSVLGFAALASVLSGVTFGLAPALRFSRADAGDAMKGAGRATGGVQQRRSRDVLVAAECALALLLLTGAGLLVRSLMAIDAVDPGFDPAGVITMRVEFPTEPPPTAAERTQTSSLAQRKARARTAVADQLLERLQGLPGVTGVAFIDDLYLAGSGNKSITVPGRRDEPTSGELTDGFLTPGFFPVLRVPLRRGRLLTREDTEQKIRALWSPVVTDLSLADKERRAIPEPVVVNEAFAARFFPNADPLGKRFCMDPTNKTYWYEIVGVVGDMRRQGLERQAIPQYLGPWIPSANGRADLLVRTSGDPQALAASVREQVKLAVPGMTVVSVSTADALLGGFSALRRLQTWLLTIFALLALTLAAVGIFGVVRFTLAERTREIGVRVALGASRGQVRALVLGHGMRTPLIGIAVGLLASIALTRVLSSLLFGVTATDPLTFAGVAVVLAGIAVAASWLAGRGILRLDPVRALRDA